MGHILSNFPMVNIFIINCLMVRHRHGKSLEFPPEHFHETTFPQKINFLINLLNNIVQFFNGLMAYNQLFNRIAGNWLDCPIPDAKKIGHCFLQLSNHWTVHFLLFYTVLFLTVQLLNSAIFNCLLIDQCITKCPAI